MYSKRSFFGRKTARLDATGDLMTKNDHAMTVWSATDTVNIRTLDPEQIVAYAKPQLSTRDMKSIVSAFEVESYEMVATFVWTKASSILKRQIAMLGMDFVGEMLGRPDLNEDSNPATSIADNEAIALAEDLGMITSTQGIRLKHALELVTHFTKLGSDEANEEMMAREEAISLLKTCITSILSKPNFEGAIRFADFRKTLGERTLKPNDGMLLAILQSPYFFIRTTLSVLLSLAKSSKGAIQEHALGNVSVLLPQIWPRLREPEKWQVGQAYAEVNSEGNRVTSTALRKALLSVHGFDFVPESLRSHTFSEAAARVLAAHFDFDNFYNEAEPMSTLANLGTAIPRPAFAKCMEATLAVWLGNSWGHSFAAEEPANAVLSSLRREQWEYYLNECLKRDRTILDKLALDRKPIKRWIRIAHNFHFSELAIRDSQIKRLIDASVRQNDQLIVERAEKIREGVLTAR